MTVDDKQERITIVFPYVYINKSEVFSISDRVLLYYEVHQYAFSVYWLTTFNLDRQWAWNTFSSKACCQCTVATHALHYNKLHSKPFPCGFRVHPLLCHELFHLSKGFASYSPWCPSSQFLLAHHINRRLRYYKKCIILASYAVGNLRDKLYESIRMQEHISILARPYSKK